MMTVLCSAMLVLIMAKNIQVSLKTAAAAAVMPAATPEVEETPDPARSEAIRKKFEALGLPLHEGNFWKGSR